MFSLPYDPWIFHKSFIFVNLFCIFSRIMTNQSLVSVYCSNAEMFVLYGTIEMILYFFYKLQHVSHLQNFWTLSYTFLPSHLPSSLPPISHLSTNLSHTSKRSIEGMYLGINVYKYPPPTFTVTVDSFPAWFTFTCVLATCPMWTVTIVLARVRFAGVG